MMRRKLTIAEVITCYTLTDEHLNMRLCNYFFGRKRSFIKLWKTKRFRLFNHHVLEELSLMAKLRFVKSVSKLPKAVAADIERLNTLRNGLAHSFFPEKGGYLLDSGNPYILWFADSPAWAAMTRDL
jgi:hypothetical protein